MPAKSRTKTSTIAVGEDRVSGFAAWKPYIVKITSSETVYSQSNPYSGGHWQGGGPFLLQRTAYSYQPINVSQGLCRGRVCLGNISTGSYAPLPAYAHPSDSSLTVSGTTGFSQTIPTNPTFDLATSLAELRFSGMPKLPMLESWRKGTFRAKQAGSEYLNYDFGWIPLVNDMRDFAHAVDESDSIINSYRKNANKRLQRAYEFPTLEQSQSRAVNFIMKPDTAGTARGSVFESARQRKWFEAEYTYYLPVGNSQADKMARFGSYARKLLGVGFNPEAIWNLAPWSWASDWFFNVGDVIGNIGNFGADGLVSRHAYIMCHTSMEKEYVGLAVTSKQYTSYSTLSETKRRLPATPYGFGVTFSSLNVNQIATIAALGMSKW